MPQGAQHEDEDQGATQAANGLQPRRDPNDNTFKDAIDKPFSNKSYFPPAQLLYYKDIYGYIMTQMETNIEFANTMTQISANAGLKKHGKKAEEALLAEIMQL